MRLGSNYRSHMESDIWTGPVRTAILVFVADFIEDHGYSPSFREIGKACGLTSTSTVAHHLSVLHDLGKVEYTPSISRSVRVV